MQRSVGIFFRLALIGSLACTALRAQVVTTAQIKGTVQDETGAAVPAAEVKVTQTGTGASRSVISAADGGYLFPQLPIGPYELEVTKMGFTKYVQTGIVLQVNSNPTIDATLKVGAITERVEVQAAAGMVETQSTGIGQVIDQQRVVDLPLNGRNVTDLLYLTGGVNAGRTFRASAASSVSVSVAGGGNGTVSYVLDGGTHNDPLSNQNLPLPFPDALQEFKVETSALPAQYGYHSAGAVNAVTKSGTNAVHGDAFEFVRNYLFNARNSFQPVRDSLKRNQFGGTIGGPIVKNKLFFFAGYQDNIVKSSPVANVVFVPTAQMLKGDFSAVNSTACRAAPVVLPASLGFTGNTIDPQKFDPIALKMAALLPTTADPCGRATYAPPASFTENEGITRIDYQVTQKNSLYGRYFVEHWEQPAGDPSGNVLVKSIGGQSNSVFNALIGDTHVIGPSAVNSFRIMVNRSSNTTVYTPYFGLPDLGLTGLYQLPTDQFGKFIGGWTVGAAGSSGFSIATTPSWQPYVTWQISEDLSWTHGSHQMSFGMSFINLKATAINYLNSNGNFTFSGQFTGIPNIDFLLGKASSYAQSGPSYSDQHQNIFGVYAQDAWKVSRRLTINAGLRWDPFFGHTNPYNETLSFSMANFLSSTRSTVFPNAPPGYIFGGDPGLPTGKYSPNKMNTFSPRIGIVWDPKGDGHMSIRAGYGFFYDFPNFAFDQFGFSQPWGASLTVTPPPSIANPWGSTPGGNPYPLAQPQNYNYAKNNIALVYGYPLDVKPTYIQQYNLSVQKQMGNWLVSGSYVGSGTRHLWSNNPVNQSQFLGPSCTINGVSFAVCNTIATTAQRRRFNLLNPAFGTFYGETEVLDEGGTSNYNGLILSAQHRFGHNFTSTTNFTWAHCISDNYTPALGLSLFAETRLDNRRADRGDCPGADVRKVFNQTLVVASPKYSSRALNVVAGGWKLAISMILQSGPPLNVTTGTDVALTGNGTVQRGQQVLADIYLPNEGQGGWLNPKAFQSLAQMPVGTFGNMGAQAVRGPGAFTLNAALSRAFKITERQSIEARGEAFNLPNWVNLYNPVTALNSPIFGQIVPASTAGLGAVTQSINDPRIMQFAIKYIF